MFEQTFRNIDDILYKDSGADSELDYIGQTSWVMFLRYLDELEQDKADEAALLGKTYKYILEEEYRWPNWAMPKKGGKLDIHKAMTGPDLVEYVDKKLFPYLASFKQRTDNPQTIDYKIGEIFSELENKIRSGYGLREILELADGLPFRTSKDKHELSHLYETKIKNMGNAGRNGGQYYTPRSLIRAMIEVVQRNLLEALRERGFAREQLGEFQKILNAENSDLYDVLAYVAFHSQIVERRVRAENVRPHLKDYDTKQQEFLNFVLNKYITSGVYELDESKLTPLLLLKYKALTDAKKELGNIERIRKTFIGFQGHLYAYRANN